MANVIVEKEDYAEMHITKDEKLIIVLIDKEDIGKIQKIKWIAQYDKTIDNYYISGWGKDNYANRQRLKLHRFLTDCPKGMVVDHINRNTCDNRKSNLRVCTQVENAQNKGEYKNNKSGYKHIHYSKANNIWVCEIKKNKKIIYQQARKDLQELINLRDRFLETGYYENRLDGRRKYKKNDLKERILIEKYYKIAPLKEREYKAIIWRYIDKNRKFFREIGAELGICESRANNVVKKALNKIRKFYTLDDVKFLDEGNTDV